MHAVIFLQELHPADLKAAVLRELNIFMDPIRAKFEEPEMKKLTRLAYPPPEKKSKLFDNAVQFNMKSQ